MQVSPFDTFWSHVVRMWRRLSCTENLDRLSDLGHWRNTCSKLCMLQHVTTSAVLEEGLKGLKLSSLTCLHFTASGSPKSPEYLEAAATGVEFKDGG